MNRLDRNLSHTHIHAHVVIMASRTFARRTLSTLVQRTTNPSVVRSAIRSQLAPALSATATAPQTAPTAARWFSDKTASTETPEPPKEGVDATADASTADTKAEEDMEADVPEEVSKVLELEEQVKELKDQLLRALAEQENTRTIARRDVAAAKDFSIKSFAKGLLDVSDNLSRALDAVPEDHRDNKEEHAVLATLYEGIQMTDAGLNKAFQMNGLTKFCKIGDVFDPNLHEALYEYPDPTKEAGTVGQVMKLGFMLNKRVLRPAEVGIVKKV